MNAVSIPGSEEFGVLSPSCIEIVQLGREFYMGKRGVTGSGQAWIPDLGDELGYHFGNLGDQSNVPEYADNH
ncbi:hypothetical protein AVEN_241358-1 [Araneus ventricosus]|uniref:Uncharacterized protein n=1 Tax=Araneus ventricosus TaxID=182803 RepID=A0A4Y2IFY1_ARAVE|nr:hypothetical protein AVEN_241358-1 [Araneus ventricosus]